MEFAFLPWPVHPSRGIGWENLPAVMVREGGRLPESAASPGCFKEIAQVTNPHPPPKSIRALDPSIIMIGSFARIGKAQRRLRRKPGA